MSYFDETEEEVFEDKPEEIEGTEVNGQWIPRAAAPAQVTVQKSAVPPTKQVPVEEPEYETDEEQEEEDTVSVLSDARLRLEMGKLYELIMKHDLFEGVDSDPKAMKTVQKEIRSYAQERMEIMLGMRQEKQEAAAGFPMELFPFNSLEVDTLKALAAAATKGESRDAAPLDLSSQKPAVRTTLNPIGQRSPTHAPKAPAKKLQAKPQTPVKREVNAKIQRILEEEGLTMDEINQVFDPKREYLDRKRRASMTEDEIIERNRQASLRNKRAENPAAAPMPTPEQMEAAYMQRSMTTEAQNPKWRQLIEAAKSMPPTIATNPIEE